MHVGTWEGKNAGGQALIVDLTQLFNYTYFKLVSAKNYLWVRHNEWLEHHHHISETFEIISELSELTVVNLRILRICLLLLLWIT